VENTGGAVELKLEREQFFDLARRSWPEGETFSMGVLALRNSERRNAVSEVHGREARRMWNFLWPELPEDEVPITHVTNGVHTANWMARRLRFLLDASLGADWYDRLDDGPLVAVDGIRTPALEIGSISKLAFYMRERA
jgi:starch phosphorylase